MVELNLEIIERVDGEEPATEKQKEFIRVVSREIGGSAFPEDALNELGKWQASSIVEQLKSLQSELHETRRIDDSRFTGLETGKLERMHFAVILAAVAFLIVLWIFTTF